MEIAVEKRKKEKEHAKRITHQTHGAVAQQLHKFGFFPAMLKFWHLIYTASLQLKIRLFQAVIQSKDLDKSVLSNFLTKRKSS